MDEEFIEKEKGLFVGEEISNNYPTVLLDTYVTENDENVFVTVLRFDDYVIQFHLDTDSIETKTPGCDIFIENLDSNITTHHKAVYCDTYLTNREPEEVIIQA